MNHPLELNWLAFYACLCNPGLTSKDALIRMGVTRNNEETIQTCKKPPTYKHKKVLDVTEKENVIKMYWEENQGTKEIASHYHISLTTVQSFMKENGIPRRSKGVCAKMAHGKRKRKLNPFTGYSSSVAIQGS